MAFRLGPRRPQQPEAKQNVEAIEKAPATYKGREIAVTMHYLGTPWLTRESREREEECSTILKELEVKPGEWSATWAAATASTRSSWPRCRARRGTSWPSISSPKCSTCLSERAETGQARQHRADPRHADRPKLPAGNVDLILLVDVYHEFSDPEPMLAAMCEELKPAAGLRWSSFGWKTQRCRSSCCTK